MNLSERIKLIMEKFGCSQSELARIAGVAPPSVYNWICGKTKKMDVEPALRISTHFGIRMSWIVTGVGVMLNTSEPEITDLSTHPDLAPVKRVHIALTAGIDGCGIDMVEEEGDPIFFRRNWLKDKGFRADLLVAVRITGSSMEPSLWEDDLVVVNLADTKPKDGDVFAVRYESDRNASIKRLRRSTAQWWLVSDNPDKIRYPDRLCTEDTQIIGRVVYRQSEVI